MIAWRFEIPGQPPSWNASYKIVKKFRNGRVPYHTLAKTKKVIDYQTGARLIVASAKPSRWKPEGQIRLSYRFYVSRDIDCDNMLKSLNDVFQAATGVDDKRVLPCVISKELVPKGNERVVVTVSPVLEQGRPQGQ